MPANRLFTDATEHEISARYMGGESLNALARAHDTSTTQIKRALYRTNTPLRAEPIETPHKRERGRPPAEPAAERMDVAGLRFNPARLRESRLAHQISHAELAQAVGIATLDLIRRWENGSQTPDGLRLLKLLVVLDLSPRELLS